MQVFKDYASYYDLLYQDKDYISEANYIHELIKEYKSNSKNILELGSGTGTHAILLNKMGYNLTGLDFSQDMVNIANNKLLKEDSNNNKNNKIKFLVGDARIFNLNKKFNVILALFHVVNYMQENLDLENMFTCVSRHLDKDGLFIFDFWYGPAVLSQGLEYRVKNFENNLLKIVREAKPEHNKDKNIVNVNYEILVTDKIKNINYSFKEVHTVRYLFEEELKFLLKKINLVIVKTEEWLTKKEPSNKTWGVCFVCKKI